MAAAIGVALASTALSLAGGDSAGGPGGSADPGAFQWGFYVAAVLAVLGLAFAVRVRDADAVVTMRRPGAPPRGANPDSDNRPVSEGS